METLTGKVVLVTGGGRGLGAAICESLAEAGAIVVAADVRMDLAEPLTQKLRDRGLEAYALSLDITDEQQIQTSIQKIIDQHGKIDVLVNNAGTDLTVSIEEMGIDDWDRILSVNLRAPFILAKQVFPLMKQQGSGHIVNVASTAAKRTWANASAYHASKWGLMGLSHALHVEGRPHGVKVTAIVAGGMRTPFLLDRFPELDPNVLQDPRNVADTIRYVLLQPAETVIPEVTVIPMRESSWP
ncbi:SDR family oxidoreductase [Leptolyngbya sp. FACHB-711]|uniref:SDR family oxidoreductase n=1 Tax=unclassified Leptolyngbya TaxID=2650499 RepID=UPI0016853450|nr:SDR family oxidoreductase [Leptolyngbya sp. FACHB-711]MBD1848789.1 SDR family oxidoreductase [Cyanobacteria bacterium FACHB-502]MBD2027134.1 SDR family oxidoreductase [Leptolyngbya sp. FACHB-711]